MKLLNAFTFLFVYIFLFADTFAGISFSEILPNTEDDANLEYIELYNSLEIEVSLSGYVLKDKSDKQFVLDSSHILNGLEKKKFMRIETKIILNNSDEDLFLYDDIGNLIDNFSYASSTKGELIVVGETQVDNTSSDPIPEENNTQSITVPDIKYDFQRPTYLLEKDQVISTYNCDNSKEECKINIDLSNNFGGEYIESDYECELDFGFNTGQEFKCNPSTIIVPVGTYDFLLKIKYKDDNNYFSEKSFKVVNKGYVQNKKSSKGNTRTKYNLEYEEIPVKIKKPEIIIQSGLNDKNECNNKKDCKINLKYNPRHSKERCLWDFGEGVYEPGYQRSCNPTSVSYGYGEFEVNLKVYEDEEPNNFRESSIEFSNYPLEGSNDIVSKNMKNIGGKDLQIYKVMPNPDGSDDFEYIEIKNNSDAEINLETCGLDDIVDGGSYSYDFEDGETIGKGEIKKYYKVKTKLNLNNDSDEVNLFCNGSLVDKLSWSFKVKDGYYLNHDRLDIYSGKVNVLDVIDGDTIKVEFVKSGIIEKLRLIGIDTPETSHPNMAVQKFGIQATNYVKDELKGKQVSIEIDPDNFRDAYSRLLGFIYTDGESFNKKLIENGYAKAYLNYDFKYSTEYKKAEKQAKENKLGIWALNDNETQTEVLVENYTENKSTNSNLEAIITIQGKIGKNKVLTGDTITCYDSCSINFDGTESTGNIKKYSWDFGNGETFEGKNPGYVKYEIYGTYKVYLAAMSDTGELNVGEFLVNYTKTPKKIKTSSFVQQVERKSDDEEVIDQENSFEAEDDVIETNDNSTVYYIFIIILLMVLIGLLLRKEKML